MKSGRVALGGATALLLWLGFYALGIAIAAGLAWLPWAQSTYQGSVTITGFIAGALSIVTIWAIFPRFTVERPEGRPLSPEEHPRLHAFVAEVAGRVGMPPPDALHLVHDANAFASMQSTWLGLRGTRVVGVGLPLLVLLDREELASVVAHELGHHHGGHVRFGPWVHRMRRSIAGVLDRLEGSSFWLHLPFVGYAHLFLRVTRGTSRVQELHADEVAARACGVAATRSALERIHDDGMRWQAYFGSEVLPLLRRGFRPPLLAGFAGFRAAIEMRAEVANRLAKLREEEDKPSLLDTHPTLSARLAALGDSPARVRTGAALDLLDDAERAERLVVDALLVDGVRLRAIEWDNAVEAVWMPAWKTMLGPHTRLFADQAPAEIPRLIADSANAALTRRGIGVLSPVAERRRFADLCAAWFACSLHERGFTIETDPGAPIRARLGDLVIEPFELVTRLERGTLSEPEWVRTCVAIDEAMRAQGELETSVGESQ